MTSEIDRALWEQGASKAFYLPNSGNNCTPPDIESQFRQAMHSAGVHYSGEIIADGALHRFYIEGHKRGSLNGAYVLHADGCPAGYFEDFKSGVKQRWKSTSGSRVNYATLNRQIEEARRQRKEANRQRYAVGAVQASYIWRQSNPVTRQDDHPYLVKKRIQPHGTKISGGSLVIPRLDESKKIASLEYIGANGIKWGSTDGRKEGCFYSIGEPTPKILIVEGFATGASLHEDTMQYVIVAFGKDNLKLVAQAIRAMFPATEIIIAGDNDENGAGQAKAREAAIAVGGKVLIPDIPGKDWNDVIRGGRQHE